MAKTTRFQSAADAMIKVCAQRFGLPKKALRRTVQEATLWLVADKIARAQIDPTWKHVIGRKNQRKKGRRTASAKAR